MRPQEAYLFTAALNELKTGSQVRSRNDSITLRSLTASLQRETDGLEQKMKEDMQRLGSDIQVRSLSLSLACHSSSAVDADARRSSLAARDERAQGGDEPGADAARQAGHGASPSLSPSPSLYPGSN